MPDHGKVNQARNVKFRTQFQRKTIPARIARQPEQDEAHVTGVKNDNEIGQDPRPRACALSSSDSPWSGFVHRQEPARSGQPSGPCPGWQIWISGCRPLCSSIGGSDGFREGVRPGRRGPG